MTYSLKANLSKLSSLACTFFLIMSIGVGLLSEAQTADHSVLAVSGQSQPGAPSEWQSGETVHLIGLPETKQKEKGSLSVSPSSLTFVSLGGRVSLPRAEMMNVSIGDVSVETGGRTGKITRAIIPFGGGSALATVTHKKYSLLTIEFHDQRGALHGAVFLLPKDEALQAQQQLGVQVSPQSVKLSRGLCETNGSALTDTIKVAAVTSAGDPVPAEYKMLIFEQLVRRLREEGRFSAVYRDGDDEPDAACPKYNLVLTLSAFQKGDAALRASTGPVGFFVGATKLKLELQLQDVSQTTLFQKQLQASQRGDTDSLDIADKIAKTLTKELKKKSIQTGQSRRAGD